MGIMQSTNVPPASSLQPQNSESSIASPSSMQPLSPNFMLSPLISPLGLAPATGPGPRAPPPSAGSSDSDSGILIDGREEVPMSEDDDEVAKTLGAGPSAIRRRTRRAQSMSAVPDLSASDISEAFSRLEFLGSPPKASVDLFGPGVGTSGAVDHSGNRGRPFTRKRPLEPDYEHNWRSALFP